MDQNANAAGAWRVGQARSRVTDATNLLRPVATDETAPPELAALLEELEGVVLRLDELRPAV